MEDISGHYKILIVDDDKEVLETLTGIFSGAGYKVESASSSAEAIARAKNFLPHIIILDLIMPGIDGIETCHELKALPTLQRTLVIFYSARSEDYSQVAAFNAGADDYVVKPVKEDLLLARVKGVMRRISKRKEVPQLPFHVERSNFRIICDGKAYVLPKKQFEMLELLSTSPGKIFTREEIYMMIWHRKMQRDNRTVDVHMSKIRKAIGGTYLKTVKGVGYGITKE